MKIVVAGAGSRGDVQPMALLAEALHRRGHDVSLYAPKNLPVALSSGITLVDEGLDARAFLSLHREDGLSHVGFLRLVLRVAEDEVTRQFRHLVPLVTGADLFVGGGALVAGSSVAEALGVPFVPVAYVPSIIASPSHAPILLPLEGTPRWVNRLLWGVANGFLRIGVGRPLNRERAALGLAPISQILQHVRGRHRALLAADPELMPLPDDLRATVHVTGAWTFDAPAPLPDALERFLAEGPAPIYLGFGSMADPDPMATTRLLVDVAERARVRMVLCRGWAGLGVGALGDHVLAVDDVSHAALFPRVSAVVHHGGAGTTAAALRAGKPQLIVPHIADQFSTARRLATLGVAPPFLARKRMRPDALAARLEALTTSAALADAASALGETLRARRGLDEAVGWLERRGWE